MPHVILSPLNSCKALTKTEDMRHMIRDIEDALSACPDDCCELTPGVQESLCVLIIQLLDETLRAAHLPILNLVISVVKSGPVTPHLERVLAKAFVEPVVMHHIYMSHANTTTMVKTLFSLVDAGIKQKAFGIVATGSALCFLLSIYNSSSIKNVPVCLRIEAEQRISGILQLDLPKDIKQKVLKPLLEDCTLCLLSTTSVMKLLRDPVENSDSILWLTALTLEQVIKYELDIDATLVTALKVRMNNFISGNLSECSRQEFQRADDVLAQLKEVSLEQQSLMSCSVPCLFPFLLSMISGDMLQLIQSSSSSALSLLVYIYSFDMLLRITILLFQHHQSSVSLLVMLLTLCEADSTGRFSISNVTEKNFRPLMQSRCLITHTCLFITSHILPICETNLDFISHSNLATLLNTLIVAQYNMLLTNDSLSLNNIVTLTEKEFGVSFESTLDGQSTSSHLSLFKALCFLYSTKDLNVFLDQKNLLTLYICGFSLQSWDYMTKRFINNDKFINSMSQSNILTVPLLCYYLLSNDCCVLTSINDTNSRYSQLNILSFLGQFVNKILQRSEGEVDFNFKDLIRVISALPLLLCLLSFRIDQKDTIAMSFIDLQTLCYCSYVTQETHPDNEPNCSAPLISVSESHMAFVLFTHLICTQSICPDVVTHMLSYTDFLIDLYCSFLCCVKRLAASSDMVPYISHILTSLIATLNFQHMADPVKASSPETKLYKILYSLSDDGNNAPLMGIYDSINNTILTAMDILGKLNSTSLDFDSPLFLILDQRKRQILERSSSSIEGFISICLLTQSKLLFQTSNNTEWVQKLLESNTMLSVCEIFDAQFFEGPTEINEQDLSLLFGYGMFLGALTFTTFTSLDRFETYVEARSQLIESLTDQSLFGNETLLSLFPASFKRLQSLLGLLASAETFVSTLSRLCLALTTEYIILLNDTRGTAFISTTTTKDEGRLLFFSVLVSQIIIYIPLLCQDKLPNQTVIKLHQNCVGILVSMLEKHHAFEKTSTFADSFLNIHLLTLHRLFDFLDSKLIDSIEYLQVYEGVLTFFAAQTRECAREIWCITLLRVVRLSSTPIPTMRVKIIELICKILGECIVSFDPADALILLRDVLFKSMSILITCSPTATRKTKSSSTTTVASCHQLFFDSCMNVVSIAPYSLKIQVIRAFISLVHSLSIATGLFVFDDPIKLFCAGMKQDNYQIDKNSDNLSQVVSLSLDELFSRIIRYPLMDSFFPEVFQKSIEHSPWLSLLSPINNSIDNTNTTISFAALFEDVLSLLTVDGKASCQSPGDLRGLSSTVLLELCSVVFSLFPQLTDEIVTGTQIIIHSITLTNTIASKEKNAELQLEIGRTLNDIPVRLAKELVNKCNTQNKSLYTKIETCLDALLSYILSNEITFVAVFTYLYEVLEQSTGQEELCRLLSAQLSKAYICSCSLGTFSPRTSSICLAIMLTIYISLSLIESGDLAESLNISAVVSAVLKLDIYPQLNLMFMLAIYNNYPIFKGVISDDILYLILSRFLPHSSRYLVDSTFSNTIYKTSVVSSYELLAYGNLDSEVILRLAENEGESVPNFEELSVLYTYDKCKQDYLVTIDFASLHQLLFNVTLFTLSFYMESNSTVRKCISLVKNVLKYVEYSHTHFKSIPPSTKLYKYVSTLLKYIIGHKFPTEIALSILPQESMPLLYYTHQRDSAAAITLMRPQLFALQTSFFHFFNICRELPLSQEIELVYLEALTAEMGLANQLKDK